MQPESQHHTPYGGEQLPPPPTIGPESVPSLPPIEAQPLQGHEAYEQRAEHTVNAQNLGAQAAPPVPQVAPQAPPVPITPDSAGLNTPIVAADEDLIEKEWVDKAKEIIQQTAGDPHARTEKVNELQRSYLQKRYGKVVGADT